MKTIGLIGGMSWESTSEYYRLINEDVRARLGGHHSAKIVLISVDFAEIEALQHAGRWDEAGAQMAAAARQVTAGGADCIVLCTNTMHKLAEHITSAVDLPFLHIADATATAIRQAGVQRVGLLGTRFTMVEPFYRGRLADRHGLDVLLPETADMDVVHQIIYDELVFGDIRPASRQAYREIIERLVARGAAGVILGCTEISLLVQPADAGVPTYDTTALHARAAVDFALA